MTADAFIRKVKAGYKIPAGAASDVAVFEGFIKLDPTDLEAVTAEAFNIGVFDSDRVSWDQAIQIIRKGMGDAKSFRLPLLTKAGQYDESKHRRGQPKNRGQFASGGGGGHAAAHAGFKLPSAKPPPLPARHNPLLESLFAEPVAATKPAASTAALRSNPLLESVFGQSVPKPPLEHDPGYKPDTPFRAPGTGKPPPNLGQPKSVDEARDQLIWLLGRASILREQGRTAGRMGPKPAKALTLAINLASRLHHQFFRAQEAGQAKVDAAAEKKPGGKSFTLPAIIPA